MTLGNWEQLMNGRSLGTTGELDARLLSYAFVGLNGSTVRLERQRKR